MTRLIPRSWLVDRNANRFHRDRRVKIENANCKLRGNPPALSNLNLRILQLSISFPLNK
jgi:hypothetical protein